MNIRRARPGDEAELTAMIHELAEFERAGHECTVTETQLRAALFGDTPTVQGHIAEVDGEAAAGALWFRNFSTWDGVAGIYLEDLFVRPQIPPPRAGPRDACHAGPRMRRERLHPAVVGGAGLERRRDRALRRRRRASAGRVDHLPGVGPGVVGAGRAVLSRAIVRSSAIVAGRSHCTADGLNSKTSVMSATTPTGTPYTHCCEPTAMYHDTGNSSSCAKTATPRPHRRPVHSAHAAASTQPTDDREPCCGSELVQAGLVGAAEDRSRRKPPPPRDRQPPRVPPASPAWRTVVGRDGETSDSVIVDTVPPRPRILTRRPSHHPIGWW